MSNTGRKITKSGNTLPLDYFKLDFNFPFAFMKLKIKIVEDSVIHDTKITIISLHTQKRDNCSTSKD